MGFSFESVSDVLQCLQIFYRSTDVSQRAEADNWLQSFQKHSAAWKISLLLLQPDNPLESRFFGATTLHSKIRYDFNDLSEEERSQLISELFVYVSSERKGGFEIQNKICITIASLALKWRQFKNFVPIIIEKMGVLDNKYMLLSTLSYLPEEISNKSLTLFEDQKAEKQQELNQSVELVMSVVGSVLCGSGDQPIDTQRASIKCFCAWVTVGSIAAEQMAQSPIIPALFAASTMNDLNDTALEALAELVYVYNNPERDEPVIQAVMPRLAELRGHVNEAIATENHTAIRNMCRLFAYVGQDYLFDRLRSDDAVAFDILNIILSLFGLPHSESHTLLLDFLQDLLTRVSPTNSSPAVLSLLHHVLKVCQVHTQLPEDYQDWDKEAQQDYKHFRRDVSYLMRDILHYVGTEVLFNDVFGRISCEIARFQTLSVEEQRRQWHTLEGLLFIVRSVGKVDVIDPSACTLPQPEQTISSLLRFPPIPEIRYTVLLIISKYVCVIQPGSNQLVTDIIQFILSSITPDSPMLYAAAASALQFTCMDCAGTIIASPELTDNVMGIYNMIPDSLPLENKIEIVEGLSRLCSKLGHPTNLPYLRHFIDVRMQRIVSRVEQQNTAPSNENALAIHSDIALISTVVKFSYRNHCVETAQLLYSYFGNHWILFSQILQSFGKNDEVVERLCRLLRNLVKVNPDVFGRCGLLEPCISLITDGYANYPMGSYMYCGMAIIESFALSKQYYEQMSRMSTSFCVVSFRVLNSEEACIRQPDIVADFFDFCSHCLRALPQLILGENNILRRTLHLAGMNILNDLRGPNTAVMSFYDCLMSHGISDSFASDANAKIVSGVIEEYGKNIVLKIIEAVMGRLPETLLDEPVSPCYRQAATPLSVLYNIYDLYEPLFKQYMGEALEAIPTKIISNEEKTELYNALVNSSNRLSISGFSRRIRDLSSIARHRQRM